MHDKEVVSTHASLPSQAPQAIRGGPIWADGPVLLDC